MEEFSESTVTGENPDKSCKKIRNHHWIIPDWFLIDTTFNKSFLLKSIPNRLGQYLCSSGKSLFIKNNAAVMQGTVRFLILIAGPYAEQRPRKNFQVICKILRAHGGFLQFYYMVFSQHFLPRSGNPVNYTGIVDDRGISLLILHSAKSCSNGRQQCFQTILDQRAYRRIQ